MFTGLIEQKGKVTGNQAGTCANRLTIHAPFQHVQIGESIAVNGVCLTVLAHHEQELSFDVSPETLVKTTLGQLVVGRAVNLERAIAANARFGGHYVSGHVDTTACLLARRSIADYLEITVGGFPVGAFLYLLPKGSITLEGVSLTINAVDSKKSIKLMLIPHTLAHTTLGELSIGQSLNIEFDYLTRIVAHQLSVAGHLNNEVEV